jgi:segregation and condensation protein A
VTSPKATARKRAEARPGEGPAAPAQREAKHLAPDRRSSESAARTSSEGAGSAERPGAATFEGQYRVEIPKAGFEGPLDLLLHLIQQHELDILDIPVSFVTERFLAYLNVMRTLTIDVASEYLVMAATLAHIKSKMLLPTVPSDQDDGLPGEEEEDPRAELVRRLLEYQKYKAAAADLAERGTLGKDIFPRGSAEPVPEGPAPFAELGVFSLLEAFEKILKKANIKIEHEVVFDRLTITDRINELTDKLAARKAMSFEELVLEPDRAITRFDIVITFLAILEMAKMRMMRIYQTDPLSPLHVELTLSTEKKDGEEPGFGESTSDGEGSR